MPGQLLGGRYRVIKYLSEGGFSETYIAEDNQLPDHPSCVVKKLQPRSTEPFVLQTAKRLFDTEAKVLYQLGNHERIPRLWAHLEADQQFYLVQEFIEGENLSQAEIVPGKQLSKEAVISLLQEVLEILAFVHQHNVVHRDIKPSNIIRRQSDSKLFLIDFGAVKEITNMTAVVQDEQTRLMTVTVGTPSYMPSEQQRGYPRFNSDIYALGIIAIQALTGVHPDQLPRDWETGEIIWRSQAPDCPRLGKILDKMVRSDFRDRYKTANEVLVDLKKLNKNFNLLPIKTSALKRGFVFGILSLAVVIAFMLPKVLSAVKALNFYNQGNQLLDSGQYQEALAAFDAAVKTRPNFVQAWTNRGFALGKLDKHLDKFASCKRATQIQPDFPEAWNCRGLARFGLGQYEAALTEYERAIEVNENFHRAWYNKSEALMKLGRYEAAIAASHIVLRIEPTYFLAWTQICRAQYQLQRYPDAITACEASLIIEPNYQPALELQEQLQERLSDNQP